MKSPYLGAGILFCASFCCAFPLAGESVIPDGYPVERYAPLWQRSPFTISSVQPAVAQASFAQNLVVVATAKIGSVNLVTLANRITSERFTVTANPDAQGLRVVSVATDSDPLKSQVTLQKGNEVATVSFDKTYLAMTQTQPPPPPTANAGAQALAEAAGQLAGATPPMNPAALRRIRRIPIPLPPGAATPASAQLPPHQ